MLELLGPEEVTITDYKTQRRPRPGRGAAAGAGLAPAPDLRDGLRGDDRPAARTPSSCTSSTPGSSGGRRSSRRGSRRRAREIATAAAGIRARDYTPRPSALACTLLPVPRHLPLERRDVGGVPGSPSRRSRSTSGTRSSASTGRACGRSSSTPAMRSWRRGSSPIGPASWRPGSRSASGSSGRTSPSSARPTSSARGPRAGPPPGLRSATRRRALGRSGSGARSSRPARSPRSSTPTAPSSSSRMDPVPDATDDARAAQRPRFRARDPVELAARGHDRPVRGGARLAAVPPVDRRVAARRAGSSRTPAIFRAAEAALGLPEGSGGAILHVGDDWAADVVGASQAGWRTAYLRGRQVDTPLPTSEPGDGLAHGRSGHAGPGDRRARGAGRPRRARTGADPGPARGDADLDSRADGSQPADRAHAPRASAPSRWVIVVGDRARRESADRARRWASSARPRSASRWPRRPRRSSGSSAIARQRRIAYRGDWLRAIRRGAWVGVLVAIFVVMRLNGIFQLPIAPVPARPRPRRRGDPHGRKHQGNLNRRVTDPARAGGRMPRRRPAGRRIPNRRRRTRSAAPAPFRGPPEGSTVSKRPPRTPRNGVVSDGRALRPARSAGAARPSRDPAHRPAGVEASEPGSFASQWGWDRPFEVYDDFDLPTYVGPSTFSNLPWITDPAELERRRVDVAIVGAPFDDMVTHRPGTRFGPRAIREAQNSSGSLNSLQLDVRPFEELTVVDAGDANIVPARFDRGHAMIFRKVREVAATGAIPIVLGGDHSITWPSASAVAEVRRPGSIGIVHFDAHADTAPDSFGPARRPRLADAPAHRVGRGARPELRPGRPARLLAAGRGPRLDARARAPLAPDDRDRGARRGGGHRRRHRRGPRRA